MDIVTQHSSDMQEGDRQLLTRFLKWLDGEHYFSNRELDFSPEEIEEIIRPFLESEAYKNGDH